MARNPCKSDRPGSSQDAANKAGNLLAVVVSYGETAQLRRLVGDLARVPGCRVVLMENRPGTRHHRLPDGVVAYAGHGNVGYGTAVNRAVALTLEEGAPIDWLLVVNSDVILPPATRDALPSLLEQAGDAQAVGFPMRAADGRPGRSVAILPTVRTNVFTTVRGELAAVDRWPRLRYPIGAFFAIRVETFLQLDGFDPTYWMYYEETDLFARLHATGGRVAWVPDAWPVVHTGAGTTGRAGLLHTELGRSAAVYARAHRRSTGRFWAAVYGVQMTVLAMRKMVTGQPGEAARAVRILSGLAGGLARPDWEPAARSAWNAAPLGDRVRMGALPGQRLAGDGRDARGFRDQILGRDRLHDNDHRNDHSHSRGHDHGHDHGHGHGHDYGQSDVHGRSRDRRDAHGHVRHPRPAVRVVPGAAQRRS
jgi:GT2 family glycosyltransferase